MLNLLCPIPQFLTSLFPLSFFFVHSTLILFMFISLLAFILSSFSSGFLLRCLMPQLSRRLMDQPNARSSHQIPTPRGGGLSFVLITTLVSALALLSGVSTGGVFSTLLLLPLPLAIVGFLDDLYALSPGLRYGVQLGTSLLLILVSPLPYPWLAIPFLLIALTALINFTNFMDGLDGLVAGCMLVAITALSFALNAPWSLWILNGSLLGFLFFNWSPAKVFMGDVGSTFLGAVFAGMVLQASSWLDAFCYLLVATPLLADAGFCVLRRWFAGQRVLEAHRLHLFQRLHQAGWPHASVTFTYITATSLLAITMVAGGFPWVFGLALFMILVGFWLDQRFAVSFAVASQS